MMVGFGLSFVSQNLVAVQVSVAALNWMLLLLIIGYMSSTNLNVDRVAAKHLVSSFRFFVFAVLSAIWAALSLRKAFLGEYSFWIFAGIAAIIIVFLMCTLLDCCPQVSMLFQIFISVRASCFVFIWSHFSILFLGILLCRLLLPVWGYLA
jgi:hypothetical protein